MTPEELTAIPGIGEKMVEKIQLAVAGHFQSIEQQQAADSTQAPEVQEQPGEAEQLASEEGAPQEAVPEVPEETLPQVLDASAEQHAETSDEASPAPTPEQPEGSSDEREESVEGKPKSEE